MRGEEEEQTEEKSGVSECSHGRWPLFIEQLQTGRPIKEDRDSPQVRGHTAHVHVQTVGQTHHIYSTLYWVCDVLEDL